MTQATNVTEGWPEALGGPLASFKGRKPRWVRRPEIRQSQDGRWIWITRPSFIANEDYEDFRLLDAEGWVIVARPKHDGYLVVKIQEKEEA